MSDKPEPDDLQLVIEALAGEIESALQLIEDFTQYWHFGESETADVVTMRFCTEAAFLLVGMKDPLNALEWLVKKNNHSKHVRALVTQAYFSLKEQQRKE